MLPMARKINIVKIQIGNHEVVSKSNIRYLEVMIDGKLSLRSPRTTEDKGIVHP